MAVKTLVQQLKIASNKCQFRVMLLQAIALVVVSGKLVLKSPGQTTIILPDQVQMLSLPGWQIDQTKVLEMTTMDDVITGTLQAGIEQSWRRREQQLILKQAVITQTDGDLKAYLKIYAKKSTKQYSPNLSTKLQYQKKYQENIGYFAQFIDGDRLTMVACLNANGFATVTADQFKVAQLKISFSWQRITGWLLNQNTLTDNTCYWRSLTLYPANSLADKELQQIWLDLRSAKGGTNQD
jgi:cyanosortase A-associated protein